MKKEGWKYCKLGDICLIYQPKTISTSQLCDDGRYLVYGANGVIGRYNEYNHKESEVLLCCRGATCGAINVSKEYSWINGNAMVVTPMDNSISKTFLKYLLLSIDYSTVITGAAQPQITRKTLAPIEIKYPNEKEQQKIVEYLDSTFEKIDKIKEDAEKKIAEAKLLFQAALNEKLKMREGWKSHNLRYCCTKASNINWKNNTDKSFKYIDLTSVNRDTSAIQGSQIITYKNAPSRAKQIVIEGDVIFATTRPTLRRVTFISKEYHNNICSTGFCVLRPLKHLLSTKYLFYVLFANSFYSYIEPLQRGANYPAITDEMVKEYIIPVPPLAEQQQIVTELDSLSEKTKAIEEKCQQIITECDRLKQAILKQVFE